ncbi:MAG: GTPase ObgE [Holosporaceae bacterium]
MKFLDQVKIFLKSGDGGDGCVGFRREKCVPFGGPDGGNGGNGGDVLFHVVSHLNTLIDYRYQQHFKAKKGENGKGQNKTGHKGNSLVLKVPQGTQVWDEDKETLLLDLTQDNSEVSFLKGGQGGLGNAHFKSSTNRAPRYAQKGFKGEECWVWLRLKLIADVGLVGLPNIGKSTLLSKVTNAKPKIDDYPFTTLHPNLGCIRFHNTSFVMADIPGLIQGAHKGKGLGHRFLGHIERCKVLLYIISAEVGDPVKAYQQLHEELKAYHPTLLEKNKRVAFSRADLCDEKTLAQKKKKLEKHLNQEVLVFSSFTNAGINSLLQSLAEQLAQNTKKV